MKIQLKPLYSKLNEGVGSCPLGCEDSCRVASHLDPPEGEPCPLSSHQAQTYYQVTSGDADIIFNTSATGDGKSLSAALPALLEDDFRLMGLYPTIELVEDQTEQQKRYHQLFGLEIEDRIDRLFGAELSRRVEAARSNRFQELLLAIETQPILLASPDLLHYITHFQYRDLAYSTDLLPLSLAKFPDLWVFDEFHIFGAHQEAAVLNSMTLIRRTQQQPRRFLFTSATPKPDFIEQLKQADFNVVEVAGMYAGQETPGYRPILQPVELEFVQLKQTDALGWMKENLDRIATLLRRESKGRGLMILNSVAMARRVARQLQELLPDITVREISGRIDRLERRQTQTLLQDSEQPVLVVATSAVDVGVDFRIHLLIFESSDAATVVQRLGRLGRHPGFGAYHAYILIPDRVPWVMVRLKEELQPEWEAGEPVERKKLLEAIAYGFDSPKAFKAYRHHWGAIQGQGMFAQMSRENAKVNKSIRDRMTEDLLKVYPNTLKVAKKKWYDEFGGKDNPVGEAIQKELLRFRGSSAIQAAVWDRTRFYTYDLLRLLPYATVEICDRDTFLQAAKNCGRGAEEFPDAYIAIYLKIQDWLDDRQNLSLYCNRNSSRLQVGELSLVSRLKLVGHPQPEVATCLKGRKLLSFLVPVDRMRENSHWEISRRMRLSPLFGLYRLVDGSGQAYGCAFNQDALLLDALNWQLKQFYNCYLQSSIF
ncbi:type I-D CRISPR-associated helicase Cas3' [Oscillatoriales cyanobacterium LEGE 11467]|uniref:Type I-D CRISPR-associated helicase Cas3 n=1 Tax=Zarconia navalis LEGE 11467 TaxID=1828826 RepID=A0A928Z982_9CYAN|nr:type I-D CRISPR-associated helicase Cas3' [Zarconia navalis]MBE9041409.1 type I-D CRISPR-associated helicase Cas3' [Zarconia navalis LEGE 11467]